MTEIQISDALKAADLDACREAVETFCQPAPIERLVKELAVMKVSTVARNMAETDVELQVEVYADAMSRYPADCAIEAIREPRHWFPSLAELTEEAARLADTRIALRRKLKTA